MHGERARVFGRKGTGGPAEAVPIDGREWVKGLLLRTDRPGSMEQAQALGLELFDNAYQFMKDERGVRIEDLVALLGSVGGHFCLTAVLDRLSESRRTPQSIGMIVMAGNDGHTYYFGDAPNWLLCEAPYSLISLLFGAAHEHGAAVNIDMIHAEMRMLAQQVGTPQFLDLDLPESHVTDSVCNWVRVFAPIVKGTVLRGYAPNVRLPIVVGFALQKAIDTGRHALDPMTIATIAMKCAMRASKIDPQWIAAPQRAADAA